MSNRGISPRVRDSLMWVAEQFTVNLHHFIELLNRHPSTKRPVSYDAGRMCVSNLRREGYLATKRIVRSLPNFIYLTSKALSELDLPFAEYEPADLQELGNGRKKGITIWHKNYINAVRLHLEQQYGSRVGWVSERRILMNQKAYADGSFDHRVDGLAFIDGKNTSVEVENTDKSVARLEKILLEHMLTYEQTLYYCTNAGTFGLVSRVAQDLDPSSSHFRIFAWSEISH